MTWFEKKKRRKTKTRHFQLEILPKSRCALKNKMITRAVIVSLMDRVTHYVCAPFVSVFSSPLDNPIPLSLTIP